MKNNWIIGLIAAVFAIILIVAIASALPYPLGMILVLISLIGGVIYLVKRRHMLGSSGGVTAQSKWYTSNKQAFL